MTKLKPQAIRPAASLVAVELAHSVMDLATRRELAQSKVQFSLAGLFPAPAKLWVAPRAVALPAMAWAWLMARRQVVLLLTP